ncbi:hypothetical protein [Jannaschia sp. CCS1]|uniref:hypothetical protein n=1 Tax=Jannaschia sp. (strain CCS1) TaxID=290400 RepID=UPI000053BE3A|nr:hypothetical protein [Jannaschia sp. CCS1]ABD55546.1 hypothetical protein Jann_2629 [Jannaschia sp. CCS1]
MRLRTLATVAALALTPFAAFAQEATVMEIVTFQAQEGADAAAVTAALDPISAQMGQYGTLVARSVAEGPNGAWTMVNFWTDRDAMNRINEEALTWPEFGALPGVANLETLQMQQLDIATSVNLEVN